MNVSGILNHILKRPCPQRRCLVTSHRYLSREQLTNLAYQQPNSGNYYKGPHSSKWKHSPLPAHSLQTRLFPLEKQTLLGQSKCLDWTAHFRNKCPHLLHFPEGTKHSALCRPRQVLQSFRSAPFSSTFQ